MRIINYVTSRWPSLPVPPFPSTTSYVHDMPTDRFTTPQEISKRSTIDEDTLRERKTTPVLSQPRVAYSYITCDYSPACVAKYCNNPGDAAPTFLGQLDLNNLENNAEDIFFTDAAEDYGIFFVGGNQIYSVVKVALFPNTDTLPTRLAVVRVSTFATTGLLTSSAPYGGFMYIGTSTGQVLKVDVGPGALPPALMFTDPFTGPGGYRCGAVINGPAGMVYFGTTGGGFTYIMKYSTATSTSYKTSLQLPTSASESPRVLQTTGVAGGRD